jgi:selenide,water dikinase
MRSMAALNRKASELMQETGVTAGTDITGFGLLGHAAEMIEDTDTGMVIDSTVVPVLPNAPELARMGMVPGGLQRNREFRQDMVEIDRKVPGYLADILFDPQTSGGLLIAVAPEKADTLLGRLHGAGVEEAAVIGEIVSAPKGKITVR